MKAGDNISELIVDLEHQGVTVIKFNSGRGPIPVDANNPSFKVTVWIGVRIGDVPFQRLSCREHRRKTAEAKNYYAVEGYHWREGLQRERLREGERNVRG